MPTLPFRFLPAFVLAGLLLAGCRPPPPATNGPVSAAAPQKPLVLLVVDNEPLGEAIAREWRSRTEQEITLRHIQRADLVSAVRLPGDAIVFPSLLLGSFVEQRLISLLPDAALNDPDFERRDIFDQVRLQEVMWGGRTVAVPLGSPRFVLAYRRDLLEKLSAKPPDTWEEYEQLAARLADREALGDMAPTADQPWRGTIEPLAGEWSPQLLLARAAPYAMHRDQLSALFDYDTLEPLLATPPYVRGLRELHKSATDHGFADQKLTPQEALQEVLEGRAAMAVCLPEARAPGDAAQAPPAHGDAIGFAVLPGSAEAYSFATKSWEQRSADDAQQVPLLSAHGLMAAMSNTTANPQAVQTFLLWLASREGSKALGPHAAGSAMFRNSQLAEAARWTGLPQTAAERYAEALAATMKLPRTFAGPRLPGQADYLAALGQAVQACVSSEAKPKTALEGAAEQWHATTEKFGVESQRRALARSMGQATLAP